MRRPVDELVPDRIEIWTHEGEELLMLASG